MKCTCCEMYSLMSFDKHTPGEHCCSPDLWNFLPQTASCSGAVDLPLPRLGNHWVSLSLWITFAFSRSSYKWNHKLCSPLRLASFGQHKIFEIHPCCTYPYSFLSLSNMYIHHRTYVFIYGYCIVQTFQLRHIRNRAIAKFTYMFLYGCMFLFILRNSGERLLSSMVNIGSTITSVCFTDMWLYHLTPPHPPPQHYRRVLVAQYPSQPLVLLLFKILATLKSI